jgi:D-arabinose 1-dehydrogenase-like Zn-dependent alcohol dehydrogenase
VHIGDCQLINLWAPRHAFWGHAVAITQEAGRADAIAAGEAIVPVHRVYQLDEIREAHAEMEAGAATGKIVVITEPSGDQSGSSREEHP